MIFRYIVLVSVVAKIQHNIISYLRQNPFCFNYFSLVLSRFWKSANDMAITCQGENLFSLFCPRSLFLCLRRHRRCRPNETNTFLSRTLSLPPNRESAQQGGSATRSSSTAARRNDRRNRKWRKWSDRRIGLEDTIEEKQKTFSRYFALLSKQRWT